MVRFLQGRAGSGKSTEIMRQIRALAEAGKSSILFVPEQFTFEMERKFYQICGASIFSKLTVTSFTRWTHQLFKTYGGVSGNYADDSVKLVLMNLALREVADTLTIYQKSAQHLSFAEQMVQMVNELKHAGLTSTQFADALVPLEEGRLRQKLTDMATIYHAYDARFSLRYQDALDDLQRAALLLKEHLPLQNHSIFLDEFKGFTEPELELLQAMMQQTENSVFALCTDGVSPLFASVQRTQMQLVEAARRAGQRIAAPVLLEESHRFQTPALSFLEAHMLQDSRETFSGTVNGVQAVLAANEYEEVDFAAATIHRLVEEGYRFRDIVVITRDLPTYRSPLTTAFQKYEIPFYMDRTKTMAESSLARLLQHALSCVSGRFSSESVLAMLKCDLTPDSIELVGRLENYLYYWSIQPADWATDFTLSTFGINGARNRVEMEEDARALQQMNALRKRVYEALNHGRTAFQSRHPSVMAKAVLVLLEELGVRETLNQELSTTNLADADAVAQSAEAKRAFEAVGQAADLLVQTLGETAVTPTHFAELFELVCGSLELGSIPQTADCVLVGSAERMRTDAPRVVLILGVNDRVFPYFPQEDSLLQDRERETLAQTLQMEWTKPIREQVAEERFIAYKTMTMPSEQLLLLARKADLKGTALAPSMLFHQLERMFGDDFVQDVADFSPLYFCRTEQSTFTKMAALFQEDTTLSASLKAYFADSPIYQTLLDGLDHLISNKQKKLLNLEQTRRLFGETAVLSPSRVEQYHRCKFRYFCEYGLGLKRREKLQLDASNRGNIVHEILSEVCNQISDYTQFDEVEIRRLVQSSIERYLQKMGGGERQTARFLHLYRQLQEHVMTLLKRLFEELGKSAFRPVDFEYQIGKDGNTPGYRLENGGVTLYIHGVVDRVDSAQNADGERMVRIIDYKTGTKDFRLADIYNGLNLQMLLYLLCLVQNGTDMYEGIRAAGVLYMPAGNVPDDLGREATAEDRAEKERKHFQMKGIIVDREEVLRAMEPELSGQYTPIMVKASAFDKEHQLKEDVFTGQQANPSQFYAASLESLVNDEQLQLLFGHIEKLLQAMAAHLYSGDIAAKPLVGGGWNGCDYCDFKLYCGYEETEPPNDYQELKKEALIEALREEQEDG